MNEYPNRIPYNAWINSQLSIARHYGGINLQGKAYYVEKETGDLVHKEPKPRKRKEKK
jgi:hypothetical protein